MSGVVIVLVVLVVGLVALSIGLKSRAGGEIGKHPIEGLSHGDGPAAPQSSGSSEMLTSHDEGGRNPFDTHGTA